LYFTLSAVGGAVSVMPPVGIVVGGGADVGAVVGAVVDDVGADGAEVFVFPPLPPPQPESRAKVRITQRPRQIIRFFIYNSPHSKYFL